MSGLVRAGMGGYLSVQDLVCSTLVFNQSPRPTQPGCPSWVGKMNTGGGPNHFLLRNSKFYVTVGSVPGLLTVN